MTLAKTPSAIDGAPLTSSLLRRAQYASIGAEGIVLRGDLKVSQLDVPGIGVNVAPGVAVLLNKYQADPNEAYVVSNPGVHTVPSVEMPAPAASAKSYILAIVIGDPDFSQAGHPFMTSEDPPEGEEETFDYVRLVFVEVASGATSLATTYPALPLARIDIPASTSTITNAMITDLRSLARPRNKLEMNVATGGAASLTTLYTAPTWQRFPNVGGLQTRIPTWAKTAKVVATVEGVRLDAAARAILRPYIEGTSLVGNQTNAYEDATLTSTVARRAYQVAGVFDVAALAGTTRTFSVHAGAYSAADVGDFYTDSATSIIMQVYFEE